MADAVAEVVEAVEEKKAPKKAEAPKQRSYFNSNKLNRVVLDDGLSYVEHRLIDEGTFEKFQDLTSTVKLDSNNASTEVDLGLGRTRKFLLETLVIGWNFVDEAGNPIPFTYNKLMELPPDIIGKIIEDIYNKNSILSGEPASAESGKVQTS